VGKAKYLEEGTREMVRLAEVRTNIGKMKPPLHLKMKLDDKVLAARKLEVGSCHEQHQCSLF
jgi:hypothetical protein